MPATQTPDSDQAQALENLLRWYVAMGVDAALDDEPHDRFAGHEPAKPSADPKPPAGSIPPTRPISAAASRPTSQAAAGPAGAEALIEQASAIAAAANTIEDLRIAWDSFDGCTLATTAARMIFAGGNPRARVLVLGAAPGSDDERQGEAFAGSAGALLDGMLKAIGLSRDTAYLVNVIPWRPPGNRPPTPLEAALCLPFTRRHIALADPAFILCLGERAAQLVLDTKDPMAKLRNRWFGLPDAAAAKLAVTFSLDYLLSQPAQKKRAWLDLMAFATQAVPTPDL